MQQLHKLMQDITNEGTQTPDRTGTGTKKLIGQQMRFNLNDGFPAVTTKRLAWRSMFSELLWFIEGSSDERRLCEILHGSRDASLSTIWTDNCIDRATLDPNRFNGMNVGNMYGFNWRRQPCTPHGYTHIERKSYDDVYEEKHVQPQCTTLYSTVKTIETNKSGKFEIIGKVDDKTLIRFVNTGSYKLVDRPKKSEKDLFKLSIMGVGYLGFEIPSTITGRKLYHVWKDMINRVYNPKKNHGSCEKVTVCKRWHNFENFYNDCFSLWGFQEYVDSDYTYKLDKDYYGSDIYSPETAIFISPALSKKLDGDGLGFKVYLYEGNVFYSREDLQASRGLTKKANLPLNLEIVEDTIDTVVRPIIMIDQLARIIDLIKTDPNSRRMVITAWNSRDVENAALGMCHPLVQFFVIDGKLSCSFYMRSSDTFLGLPFNVSSYALLTHMIASITGLGVGELIYTGGDCHIYDNHVEQVKEQLSRVPHTLPTLKIDSSIESIDNFTMDSCELLDYKPMPTIKAPMAV